MLNWLKGLWARFAAFVKKVVERVKSVAFAVLEKGKDAVAQAAVCVAAQPAPVRVAVAVVAGAVTAAAALAVAKAVAVPVLLAVLIVVLAGLKFLPFLAGAAAGYYLYHLHTSIQC